MESVIHAWHHVVTKNKLEKLYKSMPRRYSLVIRNKGWPTKN